MAQEGILVIKCDNRGSYRYGTFRLVRCIFFEKINCFFYSRGIEFEGALNRDMGNIEVADQVHAINYFVNKGLIIKQKVY